MKKIRWQMPERQIPKHPYRDSAILYGALASVFIGVTALTGGNVGRSVLIACALFVAATAYAWWRWRQRIREAERE